MHQITPTHETFKGQVTGLAFGGQGIIRESGMVIFVPFTAPGDLIIYRILQQKKSYAIGELVSILQASENRVIPPCPYYGKCGGCQLQHISYQTQLEHKRQSVEDALKRIGHLITPPIQPVVSTDRQWAYRRHITLTIKPKTNSQTFQAGYITVDNRSLIPILECQIFAVQSDPIVKQVQEIANELISDPQNEGRVTIIKQSNEKYFLHFHFKHLPKNAVHVFEQALNRYSKWNGILANAPHKEVSFGMKLEGIQIDTLIFEFSPHAFIQNHPEQSLKIYRKICELAEKSKSETILDLYCGIGISSLLLAQKGYTVVGVESNENATKSAALNAKNNKITSAFFIHAQVEKVLPTLLKKHLPELLILNPPREGLDKSVIEALSTNPPKELIYISCMPSTLARDLSLLNAKGYQIVECQPFDMFPQTAHIETLVHCKRS